MSIFLYVKKIRPYSLVDYRKDATKLIIERIKFLEELDDPSLPSAERIKAYKEETGKDLMFEPAYGAKWSALSRKRKSGLLLLWLYYIAVQERLDMTITLAQQLLKGTAGSSISTVTLNNAFGSRGRTAADRSQDWDQIDALIQKYKPLVQNSLLRNQNKLADIKAKLWNELRKN